MCCYCEVGACGDDYFGDSVYAVCIDLGIFCHHYSIYNKKSNFIEINVKARTWLHILIET